MSQTGSVETHLCNFEIFHKLFPFLSLGIPGLQFCFENGNLLLRFSRIYICPGSGFIHEHNQTVILDLNKAAENSVISFLTSGTDFKHTVTQSRH